MNFRFAILISIFLFSVPQSPLAAHHSVAATYDSSKAMIITGKVTQMRWGNPHSLLSLDVAGADGKPVNWKIEMGGSAIVFKPGFGKEELLSGPITLLVWPARDGSQTAAARQLTLPDGRQFDIHDTFADNFEKK
ncbi:MAG TPA: DUF6152 family protein [Terriglobia bacterium]|nr:DUF6152 family protein [Terriglobia bacterium]